MARKEKYPKQARTVENRNEYLAGQQAMSVKAPEPHPSYLGGKAKKK